jgi:phage head maturation protease
MDRINCPLEIKSAKEDGTFSGYAAVFGNIDLGHDVIEPGAYEDTLMVRWPKLLSTTELIALR